MELKEEDVLLIVRFIPKRETREIPVLSITPVIRGEVKISTLINVYF